MIWLRRLQFFIFVDEPSFDQVYWMSVSSLFFKSYINCTCIENIGCLVFKTLICIEKYDLKDLLD